MGVQQGETSRTPSVAYREGKKEAIERVLEQIEEQAEKRVRDGFSEFNFTSGVLNCFFVTFVFFRFPQHFWLLYILEALFLLPLKFKFLMETKPLNQAFYLLDFCWIMNFAGVVGFILLFLAGLAGGYVSDETRKQLFLGAYGTALGPLGGATAALPFVSLLFHHRDTMTGFFIHFYPPLLFYIMRWEGKVVSEAWPNVFSLDYEVDFWPNGSFTNCVFGNTIIFYLMWIIPYLFWQLFIGLDLPRTQRRKKLSDGTPAPTVYDTVFHSTMRSYLCVSLGKTLWNRSKEESIEQVKTNDFEMRDFFAYMAVHIICSVLSIVLLAYPCYLSKYVHGTFLWVLLAMCTYRGSQKYTYYSTKMYSRIIRKHFVDDMNTDAQELMRELSRSLIEAQN